MIGLAGAHRTGKTTLAKAFCEKHPEFVFVPTNLSSVFAERGITPKADCSFEERLVLQNLLLDKCEEVYESAPKHIAVITDRTPFDVLGYTLAEVTRQTLWGNKELTDAYMEHEGRCAEITEKYISSCLVIQPGIEIVESAGKAPGCKVYIDHLNILISTLCFQYFTPSEIRILSPNVTNLGDRVSILEAFSAMETKFIMAEAESYGGFIQ